MRIEEMRNEREWETFVCSSDDGTFYHSLKWKEVIERSFSHRALYLVARNAEGKIVGALPGFITESMHVKVYNSIPYSDYGGPIVDPSCLPDVSFALLDHINELPLSQAPAYARLRVTNKLLKQSLKPVMSHIESIMGVMEIDLAKTPSKLIWSELFSSHRRKKIRQMERRGFQAYEARTRSDLQVFYDLYLKNMKYIGANPYPLRFMENIWNILHPSYTRIWILEGERPVAANLLFKFGNKSFSAYVGIDRDQHSVYSPHYYLTWTEIKKAEEEGLSRVSLGSTLGDPENKYFLHKSSLGCIFRPQTIGWVPLCQYGRVLIQMRSMGLSVWKALRTALPSPIRRNMESRLARL